jgi:ribosomal protein S18 acetylase RimI-like enzyme
VAAAGTGLPAGLAGQTVPERDARPAVPLHGAAALGISCRPVRGEDEDFLRALFVSTRDQEVAQTGWPIEVQRDFLAQQFDAQSRHYTAYYPHAERLVIERGGAAVGRLYIDDNAGSLHLIDIALLPQHRGIGIGTAILSDLVRHAQDRAIKILAYVEKHNPARGLYGRAGFSMVRDEGVYDLIEWNPRAGRKPGAMHVATHLFSCDETGEEV